MGNKNSSSSLFSSQNSINSSSTTQNQVQNKNQYQDDDYIEQDIKKINYGQNKLSYNLEKGLNIDVKSLNNYFKFDNKNSQNIPVMVSIKTMEQNIDESEKKQEAKLDSLSQRPNIDLICVIDNSGSMSGEKIQNVKKTLEYLLELLGDNDRLCLILFNSQATKLCHLMKTEAKNKNKFKNIIGQINANGGTDINSGMELAFNVLKNRRYFNPVSSVFLLSDGQDTNAELSVKQSLDKIIPNECFTIHSFGFGSDHDGPMMNKICSLKDGNFYYVQKINQVDEFFVDALGGLFSVVAQEIVIDVKLNFKQFNKFFGKSQVQKTYGDMWTEIVKNEHYQIKINQLLSGVSKDFIIEISFPPNEIKNLQDFERNVNLVTASVSAIPIDIQYSTKIVKECNLGLTLFTQDEKVVENSEVNDNVEFNYLRVKASEAIEQAIQQAEQHNYVQGQQVLQEMIEKCAQIHPKNQEKMNIIQKDLQECKLNSNQQVYEREGKHQMLYKRNANIKQISQAVESVDIYSNCVQRQMVSMAKSKKSKN